jgi:acetyltransferase-like isoleucine patch superfamily enzyme
MEQNNTIHEELKAKGVYLYSGSQVCHTAHFDGLTQVWSGVVISKNVRIGTGVIFISDEKSIAHIVVDENVQIGAGCIVGNNIRIEQGSVLEPGSVVMQNVPAHAIVGGNPAKILGYTQTSYKSPLLTEIVRDLDKDIIDIGVGGVTLHRFKLVKDYRGDLSVGEFTKEIPFEPKRYFLVFNVPSEKTRGEHAHYKCHQFLICVKGSCSVVVDDGNQRREVELNQPNIGVYLPPMTWGIQYKYSPDAVLLVFASHYYEAEDYIRNYDEFLLAANT